MHDPIPPIVNDRVQDLRVAPQVPTSSSDARQAAILEAIRAIPAGFVRTYGDVSPGAPRLAGRLLSSINAPDLPWWRVVRADGSLAAGPEQRERLEAEGVPFRPGARPRIDLGVARVWSG